MNPLSNNLKDDISNNKNILAFGWRDKSSNPNGQARVNRIDLIFKGLQTEISVQIPQNVPLNKIQKLNFTCLKNEKESTCDMLKVAPEQIQNLTIKAAFSNDYLNQNSPNNKIKLIVPRNLESGTKYYLVITSDNLNLKAELIKDNRISPFSKNSVPLDLIKYIFKFLLPKDLCRAMQVCKKWNEIASDNKLWAEYDFGKLSSLVKVFDESFWKSYYDLSSYDISFEDAEKINKVELISVIRKLMTLPRQEKEFGVAILTLPKKLTLKKFADLITSPKKGNKTYFRYTWAGVKDIRDTEVEKTHTVVITNILNESYNLSFVDHQHSLEKLGCEMPNVIHASALAIFTYTSSTNNPPLRLFQDDYTGCIDYNEIMKFHFAVGIFRPPRKAPPDCVGLVIDFRQSEGKENVGIVAMKRF